MKLLRFIRKSYVNGRIIEPGEEVLMPDNFPMAAHIVDVRLESEAHARGEELPEPVFPRGPQAVFRTDLAQDITESRGVPVFPTWESQDHFDKMTVEAGKVAEERREGQLTGLLSAPGAAPSPPPFRPPVAEPPTIDAEVDNHSGYTPAEPMAPSPPKPFPTPNEDPVVRQKAEEATQITPPTGHPSTPIPIVQHDETPRFLDHTGEVETPGGIIEGEESRLPGVASVPPADGTS